MYLAVGTWYKQNCLILLKLVSVFECYLFPYQVYVILLWTIFKNYSCFLFKIAMQDHIVTVYLVL